MAKKAKAMKKEKVDKGTYEAMKPYLTAALEYVIQTGQSVRAFFDFAVERFGGTVIPYVQRFMREVREGTVKIAGLTKETRKKVLGEKVRPHRRRKEGSGLDQDDRGKRNPRRQGCSR